ncbi:MAG: transposase [Candidatus Binatia bacterium]
MARRPRVFAPGLLYHVIVRGNQRRRTFRVDADYKAYLQRLEKYSAKFSIRIYAYCLMPNHVHLLLETGSIPLAKFMQGLQQSYTQYFNRKYRKVGHLFQGRYKAIICEKDRYLLSLVRYIHLNPIRAGLAKRPEAYGYSGHLSYLAQGTPKIVESAAILSLLGGRRRYEKFVLDGMSENHNEEYYAVNDQRFLGETKLSREISRGTGETIPRKPKRPIAEAIRIIARDSKVPVELLRGTDRRWEITRKRARAVGLLVRDYGYRVGEVAEYLQRDQAHISTMLSRLSAREKIRD